MDVLVDGAPVRRNVPILVEDGHVVMGEDRLALESIFWVSRRAGLALVFARERTIAFLGASGDLEEVSRIIERGSDRAAQRSLLQPLTREVVVCTAGTAASGAIGETSIRGLHLAVFTQQALHLFAGKRKYALRWPVDRVSEVTTAAGDPGRSGLKLTKDGASITLRYLFPEEIQAVARVARREPRPLSAPNASLEMFAKGEVAPPPPADLPQFAVSAETLQEAIARAAERVQVDPTLLNRFDRTYFERHFQELGEIALGPLMMRRSAAAGADSMAHAVQAMDAEQLRQDAIAAFYGAADQIFEVLGGEVETLAFERRLGAAVAQAVETASDRTRLAESLSERVQALDPAFGRVLARQHLLLQRLHAREHATPDAEETGIAEATDEWQSEVRKLDRAYGAAWSEVLGEIADLWSERLLPELEELAARPRQRLSEGARLAILATVTFVIVSALAVWLF